MYRLQFWKKICYNLFTPGNESDNIKGKNLWRESL